MDPEGPNGECLMARLGDFPNPNPKCERISCPFRCDDHDLMTRVSSLVYGNSAELRNRIDLDASYSCGVTGKARYASLHCSEQYPGHVDRLSRNPGTRRSSLTPCLQGILLQGILMPKCNNPSSLPMLRPSSHLSDLTVVGNSRVPKLH
jgi:hypothetical protein